MNNNYNSYDDNIISIVLPNYLKKKSGVLYFTSNKRKKILHDGHIDSFAVSITKGIDHFKRSKFNLSSGNEFTFGKTKKRLIFRGDSVKFNFCYESMWSTDDIINKTILSLRYDIVFYCYKHTFEVGILGNSPEAEFINICKYVIENFSISTEFIDLNS